MASPAQIQQTPPPPIVDVPLSLFGGLHNGVAPADLPEGLSPDNQDMAYVPGEAFSRPCLAKLFRASFGDIPVLYSKTYIQPNTDPLTLALDANGNLWVEDVGNNPGVATSIAAVTPGISAFSATAFGREYIAFSDLLNGQWPPLQYDGTNLDRVTQDGPGAPISAVNVAPPAATIAGPGAGSSKTITSTTTTAPNGSGGYTELDIVTSTAHGFTEGEVIAFAGITVNGIVIPLFTAAVLEVIGTEEFTIAFASGSYSTGATGTAQVAGTSLTRQNNLVTATTGAAHGFKAGWQVQIQIAETAIGGPLVSVVRDGNGTVTVTMTDPHGLVEGSMVDVEGVTSTSGDDVSFNGIFPVASIVSPLIFTYAQNGPADSTATYSTPTVSDVWNATVFIQSTPTPTSFTYQNIGPNDTNTNDGTATIIGQISPGLHNLVVMFLFRSGAISKPSPPFAFYANGAQQALISDLPIGNETVVARIIGPTGAGGDNYFIIPSTPQVGLEIVGTSTVIEDNTSTSVQLDFADNTLFDAIAIDQEGNDLFDQLTLIAPVGFYSYASRLACWGDWNAIQNLLNMTLSGGTAAQPTTAVPGSGANGTGSGPSWTNPADIASPTAFANVAVIAGQTSKPLLATDFGFAVSPVSEVQSVSVNFEYYYTGGSATPGSPTSLSVQLLQAGVPIGAAQTIGLDGVNPGSSGDPLSVTLNFPAGSLTPAEVNQSGFGFEVSLFTTAAATHAYVRAGSLTVGASPLVPPGWSATDSTSITGKIVPSTLPGIYLLYEMTSGGGAYDCLISQPAYQDPYGTAILLPQTTYTWRVLVLADPLTGNLVADFYSPSQGQLAVATISLAAGSSAFQMAAFSLETPAVIPPDTVFRIYLSGVPAGQVVSIAENSAIYAAEPTTGNESEWSYVLNPEGLDATTGLLGSADDPTDIRCFSIQRNTSILSTAAGTHNFQDNNGEPSTWPVNNLARSVGACSIRAADPGQFGTGDAAEDWSVVANQNGLYLFAGGDFWKISQELEKGDPNGTLPTWQDVNWEEEQVLCVKNDPHKHRIYILAPVFGATEPNLVWVCDYKELDTSSDLSNAPSLKIGITGKMLATDKSRKWSRWNISANDADILVRPGNDKEIAFAGGIRDGAAYGNVYTLDEQKFTDDDYGQISPYYTTYFFVNHEQEAALGLGTDLKLMRKICADIPGIGYVTITPLVNSLNNPLPQTTPRILVADSDPSNSVTQDLEWTIGVRGERIALRVAVFPLPGTTDVQLRLRKIIPHLMKNPVIYHHASAV